MTLTGPPDPPLIFIGNAITWKPDSGSWSRLVRFSSPATFFAAAMLRHPSFGRAIGATGLLLGALLLGFNLWTFPVPPEAAGTIDWGPFCALWMLVAYVLLLRAARPRGR